VAHIKGTSLLCQLLTAIFLKKISMSRIFTLGNFSLSG